MRRSSRLLVVLGCVLAGSTSCDGCGCGGSGAPARTTAAVEEPPPAPAPKPQSKKPEYPKPGWSRVSLHDKVPFCVFPSFQERHKFHFLKDVTEQTLNANETIVLGPFGPWCVHEDCDDLPSLQCQAELEGNNIVLSSHYWGWHKDGARCSEVCRPVTAGCETPELKPGSYTIVHGDKGYEVTIPSHMTKPCFGAELEP